MDAFAHFLHLVAARAYRNVADRAYEAGDMQTFVAESMACEWHRFHYYDDRHLIISLPPDFSQISGTLTV